MMWQNDAACKGFETDLFFPVAQVDAKVPLRVCQGCPVRWDCLREARERGERYGIWGGVLFGL